ncbi:D-2-hydroxyacid dehydrogenase [Halococcus saccharolyticus]|uniref:Phosphoglycerate dehydrogenase n=1 Tax=Halococcus saccharolyticus DSM 5350 TaxID=1227455 RepID=M0MNW5_9EURY|nr:phosphoglycerate dehydrogenase [Halococcus saccharolyticus DSM 5350]
MDLYEVRSNGISCVETSDNEADIVTESNPDIAVLRRGVHGMPMAEYAAALRERLPEYDVRRAATPDEERDLLARTTVATGSTVEPSVLDRAENLRLFACSYAGYGHLPTEAFKDHGVSVTTASGVHAPNIAEHVLGFLLTFCRRHHEGWRRQQRREWRAYPTRELAGSTVTIVGLGALGGGVVERLQGFDIDTIGIRHSPERGGPTDEVLGTDDLHDALARTDHLVLAVPLTDETEGMIGAAEFDTLPPDAVVVNVARGPVIDTDALVSALRSNAIGGAGLDVTDPEPLPEDHPLWGFENVLITPHNAGHTPEYYERLADIVAENLRRVENTGKYENLRNQVI